MRRVTRAAIVFTSRRPFFQSPEFQERGYFVYRFYPVSFGRKPDYAEFVPDIARVSGFPQTPRTGSSEGRVHHRVHGAPGLCGEVRHARTERHAICGPADIDSRCDGVAGDARQLDRLSGPYIASAGVASRSAESTEVYNKYYNQAFVVMQYFGYLRRDPDALYLNWIQVLDSSGDSRGMINGFMNSTEYRIRFGP